MAAIYIIGDSTVEDNKPPFRGWGWALPKFVKEGVEVQNHALSGCSTRSFRAEGLWDPVEKGLSAGDLLLIQFGHNDEKDDERHTDPDTTYPENLWRYCEAALERGAYPVLLTPVSRRFFVGGGAMLYTHGDYYILYNKNYLQYLLLPLNLNLLLFLSPLYYIFLLNNQYLFLFLAFEIFFFFWILNLI